MRTLQEKYNAVLEGNFSKTQFRRDAAIEMPQFVSTVNSFDDTVAILKNKGAITEAKVQAPKYSTAKPADTIAPDVLDTGIKFELDKKYGTLDVTPEQYEKAKEAAIKNLSKDVLYYVKQDSIQLDEPGEKMEKAKLNESLSADKVEAMKEKLHDASLDGEGLEDASTDELEIYAQIAAQEEDHITQTNYFEYLESLPNYDPEFTPDNLRKANEVKVKVSIPGQDEFEAEEGKDYSEEEADKYIANAKKSGATPMNTTFKKTDETIQNIENDDQTKRRIAGLTNQLLQDADPRDEAVKAYAISVKNDLESGDASRMTQYKDILSLDDLKDDMEHYISHDVDQLEESQYSISDIQNKFPDRAFDIQQAALRAVGASDVQAAYSKSAGEFEQALYRAAHGNLEEDLSEPDAEDLYQHDDEYLATLKQRKALKEMFKKIITKVIND